MDDDRGARGRDPSLTGAKSTRVPSGRRHAKIRLVVLVLALMAAIVVPFFLVGEPLERLAREAMAAPASGYLVAVAGFVLLASDVVLPIPSTIVVSLLGGLLGVIGGTLVAAAGLSLGCAVGYWLGSSWGRDLAERWIDRDDLSFLADRLEQHGALVLALCRPVPVLAEASVIAAGVAHVPAPKVLIVTALANVGIAAVYAALGAAAGTGPGLFVAIAASIGLPLAASVAAKTWKRTPKFQ